MTDATKSIARSASMPGAFVKDWAPILVVLWAYRSTRDAALGLRRPILWTPQLEADRILFFGHVPPAWLQGNLLRPDGRVAWWELGVFTVYVSHFFAALMLALFLWFRSRPRFKAFVTQVGITMLIGLALYVLIPAAPPWAAGRCTAEEVQNTADYPSCMLSPDPADPSAVLLPTEGAGDGRGHVQRLTTRGIQPGLPGLDTAFYDASHRENLVAAIPSLHAAFSLLVALHLFRRKSRVAMIAIIAYPSAMGFTLVWTGDHYVVDILLGWVVALFAYWIQPRLSSLRRERLPGRV